MRYYNFILVFPIVLLLVSCTFVMNDDDLAPIEAYTEQVDFDIDLLDMSLGDIEASLLVLVNEYGEDFYLSRVSSS